MSEETNDPMINTAKAEETLMLGMAISLYESLKVAELRLLRVALGQVRGNVSKAARLLGLNRTTLHEKMRRHQI